MEAALERRKTAMLQTLQFALMVNGLINLRQRTPAEMLALQQRRLRQLLHHAARHSPFYRQRFRGIDLAACSLADLPTLTKAELMAHFDEVVTDRGVTRAGVE